MNKRIVLLAAGMAFLISFICAEGHESDGKKTEVIILHVNDMHAKIDNLPKLAWFADSLRKTHPYVFLLSAGDNFTGNPVVDMISDKGYPMIDLMNRCGFTASAIGNHEFDLGQENLNKRFKQAAFPFICCNIKVSGKILEQPKPYIVLDAGEKIRIAVLGIIELNDKGIPDTHPSKVSGIKFYNGIETARKYTKLKKKYGILVGLTHLGIETDVKLADTFPEFDLIIGGHSHTLVEKPMMRNGVMIVQAGSNLKYIGKITLEIENGHVTSRNDEVIPITALSKEDPVLTDLCETYNQNKEFRQVAGIAGTTLDGFDALGSLMTDALVSELKVDIAFQNQGGIRISSLPKGNITVKDVFQLDPFGNSVVICKMNPKEMVSLISYAFNLEKAPDLQVSGITYTITTDGKGQCLGVELLDPSGKPLDQNRDYSVAMNSYIAASYRFDHHDPGTTVSITTAEVLINYLKKAGIVDYSGVKRVHQIVMER